VIPARLIRTIPAEPSEDAERYWRIACDLHPEWGHWTYRDPISPAWFPLTSPSWHLCRSGAQKAGLIRLEALLTMGGVYIDSDVELFRPLDPLRGCAGFGLWEDANTVPDFVLGAPKDHPAIRECLRLALERITQPDNADWRTGNGAWSTGPGVTTTVLPGRSDFLLLPPATFAPYCHRRRSPPTTTQSSTGPTRTGRRSRSPSVLTAGRTRGRGRDLHLPRGTGHRRARVPALRGVHPVGRVRVDR